MPRCKTYKPEELTHDDCYKFVKVGDEFRFCGNVVDHCDLVDKGETATSAGAIVLSGNGFVKGRDYSMTLKIGCNAAGWDELAKFLNKPIVGSLL